MEACCPPVVGKLWSVNKGVSEEGAPGLHCHSVRGPVAIGNEGGQEPQVDRDLNGFAQVRAWFGHGPDMIRAWIGMSSDEESTADLEG